MRTETAPAKTKTVAIVQARYGSSRLPGKVLLEVGGSPLLKIQMDRLRRCQSLDQIVIATTGSPKDDPIADLCQHYQIPFFRGSEQDVLDRYYWAAKAYGAETIARLTADCPLIDPQVVDDIVGFFQQNRSGYDFVANTAPPPGSYPEGMDVEVFSMRSLERAWHEATKSSEREHVTFFFWKQPDLFRLHRVEAPEDWSELRVTVDYPDDVAVVESLYRHFQAQGIFGDMRQIIDYMKRQNPDLATRKHAFGAGWAPSLNRDKEQPKTTADRAKPLILEKGEALWKKAIEVIPTGTQTFSKGPSQFVEGVAPKMLVRGQGARVWDPDGNEFIDYTLGLGPAVLGHSHPQVNEAAAEAAKEFNCPPLAHPLETRLAEEIRRFVPCAEMVRYGKNGSDVTAGAVRLARAVTGRDIIACCGYHGWQDWYIGSTSRRLGVPKAVQGLTKTFKYNDIESLKQLFAQHLKEIAGVILEPVTFWMPKDNFLQQIRKLCDREGAILIFDEIITGFRLHLGGAQSFFGVTPDLATFGKAVANGWPLSLLCGKAEIMQKLQDAFFSFTFAGELPSIAAALKSLELLEAEHVPEHIARLGKLFRDGYNEAAADLGISFSRAIGLDFWPEYLFDDVPGASSLELLSLFQQEFVRRGILTRAAPLISKAHSESDIRETLRAAQAALAVVKEAVQERKVQAWLEGPVIQPVIRASS